MDLRTGARLLAAMGVIALLGACARDRRPAAPGRRTIITTYAVLGAAVKDLAGDAFTVTSAIPNGLDVHEWEPSAKDIEALTKADLIVENGLGLEGGMGKALDQARVTLASLGTQVYENWRLFILARTRRPETRRRAHHGTVWPR